MYKCLLQSGKINKQIWLIVNNEVTQVKNYIRSKEFHKKRTVILWYSVEIQINPDERFTNRYNFWSANALRILVG